MTSKKVSLKVLCVIPVRSGSKGLPGKNIKKLNGHPLVAYPISAARLSNACDTIVVSTDSRKIAEIAKKYKAEIPFIRPKNIATDTATTEETLKHALIETERIKKIKFDLCVYLTATDIFRNPKWIKKAIDLMKKDNKIESCFVGNKTHKNFWIYNKKNNPKRLHKMMENYSSRQEKIPIYREDTGLTCVTKASLWRKGKRIGNKVHIIEISNSETDIDIHNEFDFYLAKKTINYFKKKYPNKVPRVIK